VTKVLVFVEENHTLDQMRAQMPYTYRLATRFGYADHYYALAHPSLPNYLAIAGGRQYGVTDDDPPAAHPLRGPSVFGQALAQGRTAAVYADGMPESCALEDGGDAYAVRHNPWAYFVDERAGCEKHDVPVSELADAIAEQALPNVGLVVPNECHDAHDCDLAVADAWFRGWMEKMMAGPDWRSGRLAVVLTADEDDMSRDNLVLTVVAHPSLRGKVVSERLDHYALTRLLEDVAGAPYLGNARTATSLGDAFGLPVG